MLEELSDLVLTQVESHLLASGLAILLVALPLVFSRVFPLLVLFLLLLLNLYHSFVFVLLELRGHPRFLPLFSAVPVAYFGR